MQRQVGGREATVAAAETDCTSNPPPSSPSSPLSRFPEEELARNTARKRHYIAAKRKTTSLATAVSGDGVSLNAHHRRRERGSSCSVASADINAVLDPGFASSREAPPPRRISSRQQPVSPPHLSPHHAIPPAVTTVCRRRWCRA